MKPYLLSEEMLGQITSLLDQARPEQLVLKAPALALLRSTLSGDSFVPMIYVGIHGGHIQGATGNCEMRLVGGDYDTEGSAASERRYLKAFHSAAITVEHQVLADPKMCKALFEDALGDASIPDDQPAKGIAP
ncbi:MAG: hypothetical protein K2X55_12355 [Burkholderiaceae bacterium]|nr:hypothetical protein [Burkholderiaceae bacterium]